MKPVKPQRLAHRGVVDAVGVLIERDRDEALARRRVLALWQPGVSVHALGEAGAGGCWVVSFAVARKMNVATAPGAPLVRMVVGSVAVRSAAPLGGREQEALVRSVTSERALVRVRGGVAEVSVPRVEDAADLGAWIDLGDPTVHTVTSLGAPPKPVEVPVEARGEKVRPKGSDAVAEALQAALRGAGDARTATLPLSGAPEEAKPKVGVVGTLLKGLNRLINGDEKPAPKTVIADPTKVATGETGLAAVPKEGWWSRFRGWLSRAVLRGQAAQVLGQRQAQAMASMIEMFRKGNLDEGLRHAIPLADPSAPSVDRRPLPINWDVPPARPNLSITLQSAGSTIGTGGPSLEGTLQQLYRDAATSLEASGRIEEAAFVLAELMRLPGEAVALFERHHRYFAAAQLAELANLPAELRARLWWMADGKAQALQIARTHGCYAAIAEKITDLTEQQEFRAEWVEALAASGSLVAAIRIGRTVPGFDARVEGWRETLLERGGPVAIGELVDWLAEAPARFPRLAKYLERLQGEGAEALEARNLFASRAVKSARGEGIAMAARSLVRPHARDAAKTGSPSDRQGLNELLLLAGDAVLGGDVPVWPTFARTALAQWNAPLSLTFAEGDHGERAVYDVVWIANGEVVLALGEAGLSVRRPDGTERLRVPLPAHRIILSDQNDRALVLGARGRSWRVARVTFDDGAVVALGETTLDAFAESYDGDVWVVGQSGEVVVLDALRDALVALPGVGRMPRMPGHRVLFIARTPEQLAVVRQGTALEMVLWRVSGWSLRERREASVSTASISGEGCAILRTSAAGLVLELGGAEPNQTMDHEVGAEVWVVAWGAAAPGGKPQTVAYATRFRGAVIVRLWSVATKRELLRVTLEGAKEVSGRVRTGDMLCLGDDRGRVLVIHLQSGAVLRDLRV